MPLDPPIIAILTDFGTSDWYVASMKAVIARICPKAKTIDITHQIEPGNIKSAAFVLSQCYSDFPRGTIFLCVVDPGVGSERKPIVHWDGDYHFVAPDNGVLGLLKPDMCRVYEIESHRFQDEHKESNTFHGRDVFAPAAAYLAQGASPNDIGFAMARFAHDGFEFPVVEQLPTHGSVIYFDRFGNGITNLRIAKSSPQPDTVVLNNGLQIPFGKTFSDVQEGEAIAYLGSGGFLEIAINLGNARVSLNLEAESDFQLL
ncbi:SAM hydrolase/SAM-dependent halogenase family protein [Pelagicoccus mobilis]|uniref:SAM-dependent chlorinase/fluorinase n=1 Tax=Pelagicoccus mobilis TaxID=415221 RepID=A0A934VQB8_9BACT|nr:SAM-dependent chlorinase/fluorinase [Pelagicoccus mobilis]MBK1876413.1 SAM-dependent chlorinase/fluorinase [Pelagicoccus mobilis]